MTEGIVALLGEGDPSLPVAIASMLKVASDDGSAAFGDLAVAYRADHIELTRRERGEAEMQRGSLSVDEVRRHLKTSVIPRLVMKNVVQPVDNDLGDASQIRMEDEIWSTVQSDRFGVREKLMKIALETVRRTETAGGSSSASNGSILRAVGLTKSYQRRRVVDSVDIELRQGEIVGLLGPNGAGKTTTFYMIVGLIRPEAGKISIDDTDLSRKPMYKRARLGIGYLAQEPSIFRKLTVEQNVMAILETLRMSDEERHARLETLLDELSIKHLRKVPAYSLSGGERRRLEITRSLVTSPKFMLLDEPFAGVDPIAVHDIQTIVASLRGKGIGVLITDHNVEQTLDIVDRAYIMFEGEVQVSGTVRELVFDDHVADVYFGPTLTARLRERLGAAA